MNNRISSETTSETTVFDRGQSSRSLLALKRFLRGSLQRIGVASLAFGLVLNIATQAPSSAAARSNDIALVNTDLTHVNSADVAAIRLQSDALTATDANPTLSGVWHSPPTHHLTHHLTQHRLTGSRLSIPRTSSLQSLQASKRQIASLTHQPDGIRLPAN